MGTSTFEGYFIDCSMDAFVLQDSTSDSQPEASLNGATIPGKGVSDSIALFSRSVLSSPCEK